MSFSIEEIALLSTRLEAAFQAGGDENLLLVPMPNGKPFGECSGEELRAISEAYNELADRGALTASGLVARKFFNGVYLEMANAHLAGLALAEAEHDYERATPILRRLLMADPTIVAHLLDRALDDEVDAILCALKAGADAKGHTRAPARKAGLSEAKIRAMLLDGLAVLYELEHGRPFGNRPARNPHYTLAARNALEQIEGGGRLAS
jgi:hypothetical protein